MQDSSLVYQITFLRFVEKVRVSDILTSMKRLLLPNIRSSQNVGAIFRTSEAFGVDEIILTGYTPQPIDRFGRDRSDIAKSALGAEKIVPWRYIEDITKFLQEEREKGVQIISLEQESDSLNLADTEKIKQKIGKDIILVVGNEVEGVDQELRNLTDLFLEIPMQGQKESLNVAVATGVMLWEVLGK